MKESKTLNDLAEQSDDALKILAEQSDDALKILAEQSDDALKNLMSDDAVNIKFKNLQRTAKAMQYTLIITNDYLSAVMTQISNAQKSINRMLSICDKTKKLLGRVYNG